jgi:hypothetical protein
MRGLRADQRVAPFFMVIEVMKTMRINKMEDVRMKDEEKHKDKLEEACNVYKIPPQWVFAWRYDEQTDTVKIVTHGGKKLFHKMGEAAKCELSMVEISGFLPKEELFWSPKLNQRIKLSELVKK